MGRVQESEKKKKKKGNVTGGPVTRGGEEEKRRKRNVTSGLNGVDVGPFLYLPDSRRRKISIPRR